MHGMLVYMKSLRSGRAFTLVELMVVVGIILVLVTIILASILTARENTREKKRLSDLANIEFALTLYKEKERDYPSYANGAEIGVGGAIDTIILQYNGNIPEDPLVSGTGGAHSYWYDSSFRCSAAAQRVIYVRTMEQSKNGNYAEVCTASSPDTTNGAGANSYIIILDQ